MDTVLTDAELNSFVMPTVEHGAPVAWYPRGLKSDRPQVGHVIRVQARGLSISTSQNGVRDIVRHIDDPKLKLNPEHRENGWWDFTEYHKAREAEVKLLHERITALEMLVRQQGRSIPIAREVTGPLTPKRLVKLDEGDIETDYSQLWRRAKDAGIVFKGRPAKGWLEQQLADLDAPLPSVVNVDVSSGVE